MDQFDAHRYLLNRQKVLLRRSSARYCARHNLYRIHRRLGVRLVRSLDSAAFPLLFFSLLIILEYLAFHELTGR
jgi:hypothetical protein